MVSLNDARLPHPLVASLPRSAPSSAAAAPSVGSAGTFAILAGTAVTCTNGTVTGNVGVSPGTAITQTTCPVTGTINAGNAAAVQANSDFFISYDSSRRSRATAR